MTGRHPVQAAVIGAGAWAPLHVEAIRRTGMGEVAVLVGRDPVKVSIVAARLAVARSSVNVGEVLEDPTIDVIHICTPNNTHASLAHAAIAAGKHVVVEKPVAVSATEARGMALAAGSARVHGMTAFTYRGSPTLNRACDRIREGELGTIRIVAGYYLQDWLARPSTNWRLDPIQGGPSLSVADIGVHWFDAVEYASAQRVEQVVADLAINRPDAKWGEDTAGVLLRFGNGALGTLTLSQAVSGHTNAIRIDLAGDRRSLTWELGPEANAVEALTNLFVAFYRAVSKRRTLLPNEEADYPTLWDGFRAAQFVEAVLRSSRTRTWTSLEGNASDHNLGNAQA